MSQQIGSAVFHEKGKVIILSTKRWGGGVVDELLNCSRRDRATDELSHIVSPQAIILLISKVFIRDIISGAVECKTVDFSSKAAKKSVKRGVRVLRALTARASHTRRACEGRRL